MAKSNPQEIPHTPINHDTTQASGVIVKIPMRWSDMDAYGHVNNSEIVRMLEEARIAVFGVPVGTGTQITPPAVALFDVLPQGIQALIAEHRIKYVKPLEYRNAPAPIRTSVIKAAGATLILGLEIHDPATGEVCVKAHTHMALYDPARKNVLRLTRHQQEILAPLIGPALLR